LRVLPPRGPSRGYAPAARDSAMRHITGVVVCGARTRRDGKREAYLYSLVEEGCPKGSQFGSPNCGRRVVRTLDTPVTSAVDYTAALVRVILPAEARGALFPGGSDMPYSIEVLYGGPESAVTVL